MIIVIEILLHIAQSCNRYRLPVGLVEDSLPVGPVEDFLPVGLSNFFCTGSVGVFLNFCMLLLEIYHNTLIILYGLAFISSFIINTKWNTRLVLRCIINFLYFLYCLYDTFCTCIGENNASFMGKADLIYN